MNPDWVRSLRDQCQQAGVPFLFKQWGEWAPGENVADNTGMIAVASRSLNEEEWVFGHENLSQTDGHIDDESDLYRVGKKKAGRLLDGVEHTEFPKSPAEVAS